MVASKEVQQMLAAQRKLLRDRASVRKNGKRNHGSVIYVVRQVIGGLTQ